MSTDKPQILLVDDSPTELQMLVEFLKNEFTVAVATNGERAIEMAGDAGIAPKVILMDVSMPGIDGYQACQHIKESPASENVEIIFISANDSKDEKLKGYDSGGSDYIIKPAHPEEVIRKVNLAVKRIEAREALKTETQTAMDTAMTMIMDAGEQASVIHFMRESFHCNSVEELAALIISATSGLGLSSSVQIRTPWANINAGDKGEVPPLEAELLGTFKSIGRLHQRGRRLILNFNDISQLVKNMPTEDDAKMGRIRDNLALILEGAVSRYNALLLSYELKDLLNETNESIKRISSLQANQKEKNVRIMGEMLSEIRGSFIDEGGLTEAQENALISTVEKYADKIFAVYNESMQSNEQLKNIADIIQRTTKRNANA